MEIEVKIEDDDGGVGIDDGGIGDDEGNLG